MFVARGADPSKLLSVVNITATKESGAKHEVDPRFQKTDRLKPGQSINNF
jgi:hypothetical protein